MKSIKTDLLFNIINDAIQEAKERYEDSSEVEYAYSLGMLNALKDLRKQLQEVIYE